MALSWSDIRALAFDYDGTLAREGIVAPATIAALARVKAAGRKLIMVTGRETRSLADLFSHLELFDAVVAENGAVLYWPVLDQERVLAFAPPEALLAALARLDVTPTSVGRTIVSTDVEYEPALHEAIAAAGGGWHVILNKDSAMALPLSVDKAGGLMAALEALGLAAWEVMGVGDAENDEPFLALCGGAAAPANALPSVKAIVDVVMRGADGDGAVELIDRLMSGDGRRGSQLGDDDGPRVDRGR